MDKIEFDAAELEKQHKEYFRKNLKTERKKRVEEVRSQLVESATAILQLELDISQNLGLLETEWDLAKSLIDLGAVAIRLARNGNSVMFLMPWAPSRADYLRAAELSIDQPDPQFMFVSRKQILDKYKAVKTSLKKEGRDLDTLMEMCRVEKREH